MYSRNGGQYIATLDIVSDSEMEFIVRVNNTQGKKIKVGKSNDVQSVNVNVTLNPGNNTVRLVNDRGRMPSIDRMTLRPY